MNKQLLTLNSKLISRFHSYIASATLILSTYHGKEPFASHIKKYFAGFKKFGSTDRKQITHLCYCYFRIGRSLPDMPTEEKLVTALFLCSNGPQPVLNELQPGWNDKTGLPLSEKLIIAGLSHHDFNPSGIFPWLDHVSDEIDRDLFAFSYLRQPGVFIRLRPGREAIVREKLQVAGIAFVSPAENSLRLPASSPVDTIIELDKEAVIQDYSSQQTGLLLQLALAALPAQAAAWDCCAGSGGKSIMLYDLQPRINITVSDIRESILANLRKRFSRAGIQRYRGALLDLSAANGLPAVQYSLIIADVPCSGSGAWGRTPEQLVFFDEKEIARYVLLQEQIMARVIPTLQPGGWLLYITCSVFKEENEDRIAAVISTFNLELKKMETIKGYEDGADTMFAALLQKPL